MALPARVRGGGGGGGVNNQKWLRARFKMGGAYSNFELKLSILRLTLNKNRKYHENQRECLKQIEISCTDPIHESLL